MALNGTKKGYYLLIIVCLLLTACGKVSVPDAYDECSDLPVIYPDYTDVTVPCNIAPLNFMVTADDVETTIARLSYGNQVLTVAGQSKLCFGLKAWHKLLETAQGDSILVEVFAQQKSGAWLRYRPFHWHVAEPIDQYVSYRRIQPLYMLSEEIHLSQRDLTTFEEKDFYNNINDEGRSPDHCINCHAFQNYGTRRMQFHVREQHGGTVFVDEGKVTKRNLKRDNSISAGVYPSWHPALDLVAYSTNKTFQHFHSVNTDKVEVQDRLSDLILYDVKNDKVLTIASNPFTLEVFPAWSPDGKMLYYSSAQVADTTIEYITEHYADIHYNIYRRSFNAEHLSFGPEELVFDAASDSLSAILPRISPDGQKLLFSMAPYGVFHIWHHESDLFMADLTSLTDSTGKSIAEPLTAANSDRSDSFHNWSSNGRWIVFTSRRNDGNYTRLYMTYIDADGNACKAFEMPQEDPEFELLNIFSYNVPEFTTEAVKTDINAFRKVVWK